MEFSGWVWITSQEMQTVFPTLQASCSSHFCSLCHCFPSCLPFSMHKFLLPYLSVWHHLYFSFTLVISIWNNWGFARITSSSAQLTDRNKTRNVTCLQSQEVHTVTESSLDCPHHQRAALSFFTQTGSKFLSQVLWVLNSMRLVLLGVCHKPFLSTARKNSQKEMRLFGKDFTEK